ncbi:unnamed protein product [Coccothraustes coccothraustes]
MRGSSSLSSFSIHKLCEGFPRLSSDQTLEDFQPAQPSASREKSSTQNNQIPPGEMRSVHLKPKALRKSRGKMAWNCAGKRIPKSGLATEPCFSSPSPRGQHRRSQHTLPVGRSRGGGKHSRS